MKTIFSGRNFTALAFVTSLVFGGLGCATPKGSTKEERIAYIHNMRDKTLEDLYGFRPVLQRRVEGAKGYAVFSNINVKIFLLGTGHGYGMVVDNATGEETYMRMGEVGAGLGLGLKDIRVVFVFNDESTLKRFVESGWQFGGDADATAIAGGDKGISASAQAGVAGGSASASGEGKSGLGSNPDAANMSAGSGIEIYQLTQNGIALQAMVSGTKYWQDRKLN